MGWFHSIKQAVLRRVDDSTAYPRAQVEAQGRLSTAYNLSPYGICSRAPDGSFALVFDALCDPSVQIALAADPLNRFKDLAPGEVVLFNTQTPDSYVYLKANGDVDIQAESGTINLLSNVVAHQELEVQGTSNLQGAVTVDNDITDSVGGATAFTHKHAQGVDSDNDTQQNTGAPIP